ncbi:penicillin acylase family protein [Aliikangiella sp. G2MR2-5]|uniref:penicillin acylase family protein n=1 Tax=Aliikangiella sp. G2MR2-5 TaxID=2788943 RepID=UPI0018AB898E|nr:penicillin acylase family protein [Aliikangiella sp. G2MR2-5]
MLKRNPILWRMLGFIIIPLMITGWFLYDRFLIQPLPKDSGEISVKGISSQVTIQRDDFGVVYLNGKNKNDVYFAMGYAHAQDRLWQLELQRRISQGRLSEVFGKESLNQDVWIRTLGIRDSAKEAIKHLSKDAIQSLESYSSGINSWLEERNQLPIEFEVFGVEPEPWSILDSVSWSKIFALNLAGNFRSEIQHYVASQHLNKVQIASIFPNYQTESNSVDEDKQNKLASESLKAVSNLLTIDFSFENELKIGGIFVGSNAWVISGDLTESGKPLLANDPHLGIQIPSLWYPVEQNIDDFKIKGMSLVGLPVVVFGQNEYVAWGATAMQADVQDLYIETPNFENPQEYLFDNSWIKFEVKSELIQVKQDFPAGLRKPLKPVEIKVRRTVHGPVISDVVKGVEQPVALRWTALDKDDTTYESFLKLNYAKNSSELRTALSDYVAPALNILYIDDQNNIGFQGIGRIPIRNKGTGNLPVMGSSPDYDWQGYIDFDEMPHSLNPESKFIVSANNQNVEDSYPYHISSNWATPDRANRISQLVQSKLDNRKKLSVADMKNMQKDTVDNSTQRLKSMLSNLKVEEKQLSYVVNLLAQWDGNADKNSVAATIYFTWFEHLKRSIFSDEFKAAWNENNKSAYLNSLLNTLTANQVVDIINNNPEWCNDIETTEDEVCTDRLIASLEKSINQIEKLVGDDIDDWAWGSVHLTLYEHMPFSNIKVLDSIFERRISNGGSPNSINVADIQFDESEGYLQKFGAGFRQIIELHNGASKHFFSNSTGQSGQVSSEHYDDMVELFNQVEFTQFRTEVSDKKILTLMPESTKEG